MNAETRSYPNPATAKPAKRHGENELPAFLVRSQLITARQVAQLLNLSAVHVRRLAKAGK